MEYMQHNYAKNETLFSSQNINKLFAWWQNKMVHSRVGQFIQTHYSFIANTDGNLVKGGTTIRDDLYQVEKRSKKRKIDT